MPPSTGRRPRRLPSPHSTHNSTTCISSRRRRRGSCPRLLPLPPPQPPPPVPPPLSRYSSPLRRRRCLTLYPVSWPPTQTARLQASRRSSSSSCILYLFISLFGFKFFFVFFLNPSAHRCRSYHFTFYVCTSFVFIFPVWA